MIRPTAATRSRLTRHQNHLSNTLVRTKSKSAYSLSTCYHQHQQPSDYRSIYSTQLHQPRHEFLSLNSYLIQLRSINSSVFHPMRFKYLSSSFSPCSHLASTLFDTMIISPRVRSFHSSRSNEVETVKVPQMAESISEGTLKQWLKKAGDFVKTDEEVATIETDKIDVSVNAPKSGTIVETLASEEDTVTVGQDLFRLEPGEDNSSHQSSEDHQPVPTSKSDSEPSQPAAAKDEQDAKKKAESTPDHLPTPAKSEPASSPKSSSHDRKRWDDVQVENKEQQPHRVEPQVTESKLPLGRTGFDDKTPTQSGSNRSVSFDRTDRRVKMNRMRSRISERLKQSQNTAASLTTFNEIDMSSLMEMRKLYKDDVLKRSGVKIGFMSAFAKAACLALREIPAANASIEGPGVGDTIVYRDYVDLSVAVATPKGLVTPVVRNAESLGFVEIEQEIANLGSKARDNKLSLEDMAGGTFTISNGGVFGSLYGTVSL